MRGEAEFYVSESDAAINHNGLIFRAPACDL